MKAENITTRFGLKEATIEKIIAVFSQYSNIQKVLLYGSRAKGNYRNGSDIDLTLIGENISYAQLSKIDIQIDDLLLPYSFDISIFKDIENLDLIDHINRVGLIFYERSLDS
jgi:predicted nucleotidyltransferase